jgi:hypothetical protein
VYDNVGNVVLDPDSQIRETIAHFFETFARVGSACQTVKVFRHEDLRFPSRVRNREGTIFRPLTASTAIRTLNNPRYAGVYVYGRRRYRRTADGKNHIQSKRQFGDWLACIPNAHPGYITWERFQENLKILETNGRGYELARASPPREGTSLLQGRAVCGKCGQHMRVRYAARRRRLDAWYVCDRAHGYRGEPHCQAIAGPPIDAAIGALVVEKMTPAAIELAVEIRREIETRHEEADRLRCRAIERAQVEADLAQRRFMLVDPSNRLVADTLEAEWNEKLRVLTEAREERERGRQEDQLVIDDTVRGRLVAMTTDFKSLWADPGTPNRERKRLLAYLIEDATLIKDSDEGTTKIHVRFKGGKTETLTTQNPKTGGEKVKTQPKIVELVDKLLDDHVHSEIAERLNELGFRPGGSARPGRTDTRFNAARVAYLVHRYRLRSRYDRLREKGMLTKQEAAARFGIHQYTLIRWAEHGLVARYAYNAHAYLYEPPGRNQPVKQCSRWNRLVDRAAAIKAKTSNY